LTWQDNMEAHQVGLRSASAWSLYLPMITLER